MRESLLFVRPPRPVSPFDDPPLASWPPLAFATLAAALRSELAPWQIEILDAPALAMGWRSLAADVARRRPTVVALGEDAVTCVEALRLARLAHQLGALVIAGGCFFGHVAEEVLATGVVDLVVHGEGEQTLVEAVRLLPSPCPDELANVSGISFRNGSQTIRTATRPLLPSLDAQPLPAYDLLPVARYGAGSRNYPNLATLELGRGTGVPTDTEPSGSYRAKSPERLAEEVAVLVGRHDRRYLVWVDACFNQDPRVPGELAERLLRRNLRIGQTASLDPGALTRDAASGALAASIRSGLDGVRLQAPRSATQNPCLPVEPEAAETLRLAVGHLRRESPHVFVSGVFEYGLPGDTAETMDHLHAIAIDLGLDQTLFVPRRPFPGTPGWQRDLWDPTGEAFRDFHFLPDSSRDEHLRELEAELDRLRLFRWSFGRIRNLARQFRCPHPRRRSLRWQWLARTTKFHARNFLRKASLGPVESTPMTLPAGYEE